MHERGVVGATPVPLSGRLAAPFACNRSAGVILAAVKGSQALAPLDKTLLNPAAMGLSLDQAM